jgi:hypothetical protein
LQGVMWSMTTPFSIFSTSSFSPDCTGKPA